MPAAPARVAHIFAGVTGVLAPVLIAAELLNARWKITRAQARAPALESLVGLFARIRLAPTIPRAEDAARLAERLDHPVYDCLYAVLAQRENARLVTADRRFAAKLACETFDVVTVE